MQNSGAHPRERAAQKNLEANRHTVTSPQKVPHWPRVLGMQMGNACRGADTTTVLSLSVMWSPIRRRT